MGWLLDWRGDAHNDEVFGSAVPGAAICDLQGYSKYGHLSLSLTEATCSDRKTGLTLHPWGVRAMFAYPGFFEFLINRSTDTTKVGKEWKYAIIESLVRNQEENRVREVLDDAASDTLLSYLAQGVFYQRGENATMIASKSG